MSQTPAHGSIQSLNLWAHSASQAQALFQSATQSLGTLRESSSGAQFKPAIQSQAHGPISHSVSGCSQLKPPSGEPAAAQVFLTKQLPTVLNKCTAFHTAQLSNQSGDYPSQGLTRPNSSFLQMLPCTPISLVPVSTVPADVYCLCVSPTSSLFPPATSGVQDLPGARCPPCSGRGGSW